MDVRTLANSIGVAVGDEQALESRLDDIAQGVVHHAVSERRRADLAPLRLVDEEVDVWPGPVRSGLELVLELEQSIRQLVVERGHGLSATLAARRLGERVQEVVEAAQPLERFAHVPQRFREGGTPWPTRW